MMNYLRWKKWFIGIIYHLSFLAGVIIGIDRQIDWLVYLGIFDLFTLRLIPIVRFIQIALIPNAHCSSCHGQTKLRDYWQCSCGYASQVSRHIFRPCPNCGNTFSFIINCQHCGVGILV